MKMKLYALLFCRIGSLNGFNTLYSRRGKEGLVIKSVELYASHNRYVKELFLSLLHRTCKILHPPNFLVR